MIAGVGDDAAHQTAQALGERLGATVSAADHGVDLLVVGSRPEAREGRVMVTAQSAYAIENSPAPVLVVPRGVAIRFAVAVGAAH